MPQIDDIADPQWFPIDALPNIPPRTPISGSPICDEVAAMRDGST